MKVQTIYELFKSLLIFCLSLRPAKIVTYCKDDPEYSNLESLTKRKIKSISEEKELMEIIIYLKSGYSIHIKKHELKPWVWNKKEYEENMTWPVIN